MDENANPNVAAPAPLTELELLKADVRASADRVSSLRVLKDELEHELTDLEEEGATKDVDVGGTERRTIDQDRAELLELQQERCALERQLLALARQRPQIVLGSTTAATMSLKAQATSAGQDADLRHATKLRLEAAKHRLYLTGKVLSNMIEAREDAAADMEKSIIEEKTTCIIQQRVKDAAFEDMVAAQSAR